MPFWNRPSTPRSDGSSALKAEVAEGSWSAWGEKGPALARAAEMASIPETRANTKVLPPAPARSGAQVLIIDDEHLVLKICGSMLKQLGARWHGVTNGREGVEWLRSGDSPCDLLLLDVMLGDTTGFDVYRKVRTVRQELPIVFISGFCSQEVLSETLEDDPLTSFLPKPFSLADMRLTLSAFSL